MEKRVIPHRWHITLSFLPCVPAIVLLTQGMTDALGPDPGRALVHSLGLWALRLLLLTLSITPLQRFTPIQWLPLRRTLGLYTLAYAVLHFLCYAIFYLGFDISGLGHELVKRPYIVVGASALALLIPLGVTSTRHWQRRLGRRWKYLHRAIYGIAPLVLVHFAWQVKAGLGNAPWYALVFFLLMLARYRRRTPLKRRA
ncbi:MAG TPA: protein-methionine-sulfoxide reductase heme-binding subunit MsrQ [Pseudomonadales bacterium]|nr:protein-methionine-sulfoxide reductase heme-binding subunit MsrQ [Pseudomonadales bacterium]